MNAIRRALSLSRCHSTPMITVLYHRGGMCQHLTGEVAIGSSISRTRKRKFSSSGALAPDDMMSSPSISSYIVIGNGPIGASVAKHLIASLATNATRRNGGHKRAVVTIVDGRPVGMGSSHADRARLIRTFDAEGDVDWTGWNRRSLEAFPEIERLWNDGDESSNGSNVPRKSFFTKCGALMLGDEEFVVRSKQAADESVSSMSSSSSPSPSSSPSHSSPSPLSLLSLLSPTECQRKWPYLKPKAGCDIALFDPFGGIIDPLAFIEAQNHNAASLCATPELVPDEGDNENIDGVRLDIVSGVATKIRNRGTAVELASGKLLSATEKIILCGGAYSGSLLENSEIGSSTTSTVLRASKRTVALLEVDLESVEGILRNMPTIKYAFGLEQATTAATSEATCGEHSRVEAGSVYILPPVYYPERGGKWFVKIGGGPNDFFEDGTREPEKKKVLDDWLSSEGDVSSAEWLSDIGRSLLPGVGFESLQSMACVTTTTTTVASNGVVVDDVLGDGSLVAVSACQGKGAGPSDALGADIVRSLL